MTKQLETPVSFFVWIRPEQTKKVFDKIKEIKPKKLYIISDGPRNLEEKKLNDEVKRIFEKIDWPCDVKKNYSDVNIGCKKRISSGIDWVFETEEKTIILEDDCLPNKSFFIFCDELLEKYKHSPEIMMISGNNFQQKNKKFLCENSYYFSKIANIWGWATWKRAWKKCDISMNDWTKIKKNKLIDTILPNPAISEYFENLFDAVQQNKTKKTDTWDAQWFLTVLLNGLSVVPGKNLVSNIGFGADATRSKESGSKLENITNHELTFPLQHPKNKTVNQIADLYSYKFIFRINNTLKKKIKYLFRHYTPFLYFLTKKISKGFRNGK